MSKSFCLLFLFFLGVGFGHNSMAEIPDEPNENAETEAIILRPTADGPKPNVTEKSREEVIRIIEDLLNPKYLKDENSEAKK